MKSETKEKLSDSGFAAFGLFVAVISLISAANIFLFTLPSGIIAYYTGIEWVAVFMIASSLILAFGSYSIYSGRKGGKELSIASACAVAVSSLALFNAITIVFSLMLLAFLLNMKKKK